MTDLSYSSYVLSIFMPVTGVNKGHDMMSQNLPSFSCLRIITSIIGFTSILSKGATYSSVWSIKCKKVGINIVKIGICLTITNKSII